MEVEKILRGVPQQEKVFRSQRRVMCFTATDAILALSRQGYSGDEIRNEIRRLLSDFRIFRIRAAESNPRLVDIHPGLSLEATDMYAWSETQTSYAILFYAFASAALIIVLVLFQIWPDWLKRSIGYLRYPIGGFIAFILLLAFIRLIVFSLTYLTCNRTLWLFPNLFADCGFFESFVPAYQWYDAEEAADAEKKNK